MKQAATRDLYAYWNRLRAGRRAPARADVDPTAIPYILPDLLLIDEDDFQSFTVRLAGTRMCELAGRELKGSPFPELWDDPSADGVGNLLRTVTDESSVAVASVIGQCPGQPNIRMEAVFLPFAPGGPTRIMGALVCAGSAVRTIRRITALHLQSTRYISPDQLRETLPPLRSDITKGDVQRIGRFFVYRGGQQ